MPSYLIIRMAVAFPVAVSNIRSTHHSHRCINAPLTKCTLQASSMTYIATTSSFCPAVDDRNFNHPDHSHSQAPTDVQQNCPPFVPNCHLNGLPLCDPLHRVCMVPIPSILIAESEHHALCDPRNMSVPSLPNHLDPLLEQSPYDISYINQSCLHQADETTPVALPAPGPPGLPYSPAPLTTQYPRSLPEPTNDPFSATSAFDQAQIQASNHPPSTSTTFHEFGGIAPAPSAPPVPSATANPAAGHSNTFHHCQCITGGSPCNGTVQGTIRSIRDHLNRIHGFRGPGKDLVDCLWAGCERGLQRENIPRHIVTRHLRVKSRENLSCGTPDRFPTRFRRVECKCTLNI